MFLPRPIAFWLIGSAFGIFLFASSAPSPLFVVYQAEFRFSEITLTIVFAAYVVALLLALLFTGSLSDAVGRRPVVIGALLVEMASMALFVAARDVTWLFAARLVQGLATGAATGALSATVIDLGPSRKPQLAPLVNSTAPSVGLALGALGSGLLVQYAPAPRQFVFLLLIGALVGGTLGTLAIREPVTRPSGGLASLRPHVRVPHETRGRFVAVVPTLVATWALTGIYLSLGPSIAAGILHVPSHLIGGLVIFALTGTAAATAILVRSWEPRRAMLVGALGLVVGMSVTLSALLLRSAPTFFGGTVIAGFGYGVAFLGAFRTSSDLATPDQRAGLLAAVYIVCYLAVSLPAVAAGIAVTVVGLVTTSIVYSGAIAALAISALAADLALGRRDREQVKRPRDEGAPPPCAGTVPPAASHRPDPAA